MNQNNHNHETLDDLLSEFVSKEQGETRMAHPYNEDGKIIATNAHVMLIAPDKYFKEVPQNGAANSFPNWKKAVPAEREPHDAVITMSVAEEVFNSIPVHDLYEWKDEYEICSECDGEGTTECDECGHEKDCSECEGEGKFKKMVADKSKAIGTAFSSKAVVKINDVYFNANFLRKAYAVMKRIGAPNMVFNRLEKQSACVIVWEDVKVIVMPMMVWDDAIDTEVYLLNPSQSVVIH
jgi:hypothetical protein